ncbi:hypothetical protein FALBO_2548 [Fusarium albosuccineum]|uniref:C2H2-type domain-containing protein n=1 Tax=Fusarium albosuccineum TaxID=1237068 RepID=A0A8H4LMZ2_9HYPO|nr:hypothetical protein FALBO_2548 [Fusarium albosuccineum]
MELLNEQQPFHPFSPVYNSLSSTPVAPSPASFPNAPHDIDGTVPYYMAIQGDTLVFYWAVINGTAVFLAAIRSHGHETYVTSSSSTANYGLVPGQGEGRRERKSGQRHRGSSSAGGSGGNNNGREPLSQGKGKEPGRLTFDCPFHKLDPFRHGRCGTYGLTSFSRVKQHLSRVHLCTGLYYCLNCREEWSSDQAWGAHLANQGVCQFVPIEQTSMLFRSEYESLRSDPRISDYEKWYHMWRTLFPWHAPPSSPYVEPAGIEVMASLRSQMEARLPTIIAPWLVQNGINPTNDVVSSLANTIVSQLLPPNNEALPWTLNNYQITLSNSQPQLPTESHYDGGPTTHPTELPSLQPSQSPIPSFNTMYSDQTDQDLDDYGGQPHYYYHQQ